MLDAKMRNECEKRDIYHSQPDRSCHLRGTPYKCLLVSGALLCLTTVYNVMCSYSRARSAYCVLVR